MKHENLIKSLIGKWPTRAKLAVDIDVSVERVHKWAQSGSIPQEFLLPVLKAAKKRRIELTPLQLLEFHAREEGDAA